MKTIYMMTRRNATLFFKDLGMFLTSLITPLILLLLYATFLCNVYRDSFLMNLGDFVIEERLVNGLVAGQLFSSILAVSAAMAALAACMMASSSSVISSADLLCRSLVTPYWLPMRS